MTSVLTVFLPTFHLDFIEMKAKDNGISIITVCLRRVIEKDKKNKSFADYP